MINTYIVPVSNGNNVWIETVKAKDYNDSLEKFIEYFSRKFEIEDYFDDWEDFQDELSYKNIIFGEVKDIEEL